MFGLLVIALFSTPTHGLQIQPRPNDWTQVKRNQRQIQFGPTFEDFSRQIQFGDEEANAVLKPSGRRDWSHTVYDDDFFVWDEVEEEATTTSATTPEVPGMGTTQSACEDRCLTTQQYDPACGSDGRTYHNFGRLKCARRCGKAVTMVHRGSCTRRGG